MRDVYFDSGKDHDECPVCGDGLKFEYPCEDNEYWSGWYCVGCDYIGKWECNDVSNEEDDI